MPLSSLPAPTCTSTCEQTSVAGYVLHSVAQPSSERGIGSHADGHRPRELTSSCLYPTQNSTASFSRLTATFRYLKDVLIRLRR